MKVYAKIRQNGEYHSQNISQAVYGFREMGAEIVRYQKISDIYESVTKEDIVLDYITQVEMILKKFGVVPACEDYPVELRKFMGRNVWKDTINSINTHPEKWGVFVKPVKSKAFTGHVIRSSKDLIGCGSCYENYEVLCCDVIAPKMEWRGFIIYDELVDIRPYRGDYHYHFDAEVVDQIVEAERRVMRMYQAGLVLEGGGMKGVYTAGVLDFFTEKGIDFSHIYGVSAGACHMCSYLSRQKGRALSVSVDYLDTRRYCSLESLLTSGDLFNVDFCYHLIPEYLYPYDYETFEKYPGKAYSVVTNIETGQPEYLRVRDIRKDIDKIRASASLPLVARNVKIDGKLYLDGGISDAIPLEKSILDGNRKNIVVMTKEVGFVRKPASASQLGLIKLRYLKYPKVYELMADRHIRYNESLDYIERQEKCGQAFVIRPHKKSDVGRIEKDKDKLIALYEEGYREAEACYEDLLTYLEK